MTSLSLRSHVPIFLLKLMSFYVRFKKLSHLEVANEVFTTLSPKSLAVLPLCVSHLPGIDFCVWHEVGLVFLFFSREEPNVPSSIKKCDFTPDQHH